MIRKIAHMDGYVVVIGAANIDIGGHPKNDLIARDSNPGSISIGYGGVGRNIAHNLRMLDVPVKLISTVGEDALGRDLLEDCRNLGIDISDVLIDRNETSSMYMYINDVEGDMALALCHVKIDSLLTPEYFRDKMDTINNAKCVVIDCNLSPEAFEYLAKNCTAPIFVDPVSQTHAHKIGDNLGYIHTIKPNALEAEYLTDMTIRTVEDAKSAANSLIETGIERVFLSMDKDGILAADREHMVMVPCCPTDMVCTTGAGDSSMAAIVWSYYNDVKDIAEVAKAANAVASLTIESVETINPLLNKQSVINKILEAY